MLEQISNTVCMKVSTLSKNTHSNKQETLVVNSDKNNSNPCFLCKSIHPIFKCITFKNINLNEKDCKKLCINCLSLYNETCFFKFKRLIRDFSEAQNYYYMSHMIKFQSLNRLLKNQQT